MLHVQCLDKPGPVWLLPRCPRYPQIHTKANTGPSASTPFAPTGPVCKDAGEGRRQETGGESQERVTLKRMGAIHRK